ncbi:MAG: hypothetical protein JXN59_12800 [Anaerolineae bacterium]|nr:hypothetical protein [Anaerolineae bacterium]
MPIADFAAEGVPGRALRTTVVVSSARGAASDGRMLWPDAMIRLVDRTGEWYQTPEGRVAVRDVQPMLPLVLPSDASAGGLPGWAVVVAPAAPVRAWAAAGAPLVTRIGYGGVLPVSDVLQDEHGSWYAVAEPESTALLGWTQAERWYGLAGPGASMARETRSIELDRSRAVLTAFDWRRAVLQVPVTVPRDAAPGVYSLTAGQLSGSIQTFSGLHRGAGWMLKGESLVLYGAHWHNDFGAVSASQPGWSLPPWAAQWLFGWLPLPAAARVI